MLVAVSFVLGFTVVFLLCALVSTERAMKRCYDYAANESRKGLTAKHQAYSDMATLISNRGKL